MVETMESSLGYYVYVAEILLVSGFAGIALWLQRLRLQQRVQRLLERLLEFVGGRGHRRFDASPGYV